MPRRAITEAEHENCDDDQSEVSVSNSTLNEYEEEPDEIVYEVRCSCGEEGVIHIDENGTHAGDGFTHENASWNSDSDESEAAA